MTRNDHPVTMLFKCPGPLEWEGIKHEHIVVPNAEIEGKLAEGWRLTPFEAADAAKAATEQQLQSNEAEQAAIADKLAGDKPQLTAVHKGRGVWALVDADGVEVKTGLTKAEAHA